MESAVVNARVPVAKRDAAKSVLESMGKTTSDLINSAYDYLLHFGSLPGAEGEGAASRRDVTGFSAFLSQATLAVDWGADADVDYKDLRAAAVEADYERLG